MGTFRPSVTLYSESGGTCETLDAVVDGEVLFAVIPTSVLERLGVAIDEVRGRPIGHVRAQLEGQEGTIMCVFGDDSEPARIGRHTLDTLLLEADFEEQRLGPKTFRLIQHI